MSYFNKKLGKVKNVVPLFGRNYASLFLPFPQGVEAASFRIL